MPSVIEAPEPNTETSRHAPETVQCHQIAAHAGTAGKITGMLSKAVSAQEDGAYLAEQLRLATYNREQPLDILARDYPYLTIMALVG